MKKNIKWLLIFDIMLFALQLVGSVLCCIIGNSICSSIMAFGSGVAFMGAIEMYDMYKNYKE